MGEITRRQALKAAPAVAVAVAPALAIGLAPQAAAGPSFGERVLALSPERQQVMMEALAAAEAADAGGTVAETEVERLFWEWRAAHETMMANSAKALGLTYETITREYEERFNELVGAACLAADAVIEAPAETRRDARLKAVTYLTEYAEDELSARVVADVARFLLADDREVV